LLTHAAVMGANVRVGLEDSLYLGRGQLATEQRRAGAARSAASSRSSAYEVATPDEARAMLALKGAANVAF
jgi:uncharacterized protein (DUF849 family)